MAGVASLMRGPQGQQGPMPGQAQQQPMPGMMPQQGAATPAAMVGPLTQMHMQQLVQLMLNPRPDGPPLYAVMSALAEKQKAAKTAQAMQGQQVMAQNQQMQQQPPVAAQVVQAAEQMEEPVMAAYGGEMHGYAGGGAVAFTNGTGPAGLPYPNRIDVSGDIPIYALRADKEPGESEDEYRARKEREAEEARAERPIPRGLRWLKENVLRPLSRTGEQRMDEMRGTSRAVVPTAAAAAQPTDTSKLFPFGPPESPMMSVPEIQVARARRQVQNPTGNKPSAMSQGLGFLAEQPSTPGPDTLSDIESKGIAGIRGVQDVYRQQGTTDPELMKLREAAYKSSQDIAARRERDRQAALQAAQAASADPTDLLLAMAGSAAGGKTALDVLSGAAKGAGTARAAKRAELQKAQAVSSQEQKAIEDLNQALAEKRVADRSGDVNLQRQADIKVAEAQLKITDLRSGIEKERATQLDRAEQRDIQRGQLAVAERQARLAAAQAGREPEKIRMMRTLGIPITEAGFKTFVEIEATGRLEGAAGRNNVAALRELGEWEKGLGANIKAMNAKNPQVFEDARRAKIREINAALGANIPLGGGAGQVDTNNPLLKQ